MNVVEDLVTSDLISDKYATKNPTHISSLRDLFVANGLGVPRLNDADVDLRRRCMDLAKSAGLIHEASFAFLKKDQPESTTRSTSASTYNCVYVEKVESPGKFYVLVTKFNKQLESLNKEMELFLKRMEDEKMKGLF